MWNTFPFHPHEAGKERNREKIYPDELEYGKGVLKKLVQLFDIDQFSVYAVGREAQKIFPAAKYICHPAARPDKNKITGEHRFNKKMDEYFK